MADVELLPLPNDLIDDLIDYKERIVGTGDALREIQNAIQEYARACVIHATAAKSEQLASELLEVLADLRHSDMCLRRKGFAEDACICGLTEARRIATLIKQRI